MVTIEQPELVSSGGGIDTYVARWSSDLPDPEYTVYLNGVLALSETTQESYEFAVASDRDFLLTVVDDGSAPEIFFSGVVVLGWHASEEALAYRVDQWTGAAWSEIARVLDDGRGWFEYETDVLDDGADEQFRVVAESATGAESTPFEVIVAMARNPDVPAWEGSYDSGSGDLTIAAA